MGLFDVFKFKKPKPQPQPVKSKVKEEPKSVKEKKSPKDIATENGEPYVAVISFDLDPENMHQGAFELDWNDKFITNLVRAGYQKQPNEPENVIIDRWFQNVCRHVVLETWEQEQAMNPSRFHKVRDLGDGYSEVS